MPRPHEQDLIKVRNIAVNDSSTEVDIVRVPHTLYDELGKETAGYYEEQEEVWDHRKGFRVKWGGKPHIIKPGESKVYPRFLAEHFANKLADHVLTIQGKKVNDKTARNAVMGRILEEVVTFYEEDDRDDAELVYEQVEKANKRSPKDELVFEDETEHFMGKSGEDSELSEDEALIDLSATETPRDMPPPEAMPQTTGKVSRLNDKNNPPTKAELVAECEALEIELSGTETVPQLIAKIKQFA